MRRPALRLGRRTALRAGGLVGAAQHGDRGRCRRVGIEQVQERGLDLAAGLRLNLDDLAGRTMSFSSSVVM